MITDTTAAHDPAPSLTLVVLAAGIGRRYGGLKQIDTFGPHAERILDYSIYDALQAGFSRVVFVIRHDIAEAFREVFADRFESRIDVAYAYQEHHLLPPPFQAPAQRAKPWGTAHALWCAREAVPGAFAVVNADDFYGPSGYRLLAEALRRTDPESSQYALVAYALNRTLSAAGDVARGVCAVDPDGLLQQVTEVPRLHALPNGQVEGILSDGTRQQYAPDTPVSLNLWGFTRPFFAQLETFLQDFLARTLQDADAEAYLPAAVDAALQSGRATVQVLTSPDRWMGVTYPRDREPVAEGLRALVDQGVYPSPLWPDL